jgi:hypothetical protein
MLCVAVFMFSVILLDGERIPWLFHLLFFTSLLPFLLYNKHMGYVIDASPL